MARQCSNGLVDSRRWVAAAVRCLHRLGHLRRAGDRALDEFGAFCAFMCSVHAGHLTGQNILLDGGAYPATF
jgi:hypothetical protein